MAITPEQQAQFDKYYKQNPNNPYIQDLQKNYGYTPSTSSGSTGGSTGGSTVSTPSVNKSTDQKEVDLYQTPVSKTTAPTVASPPTVQTESVKMWTGTGFASVNPKYVDRYIEKGWSLDLPSDEQVSDWIENPIETGQVRNPVTGEIGQAPTLPTPAPVEQADRTIIGTLDGHPILQVGPDGSAPANAQVGDIIRTNGGDYLITGGTSGNWQSAKYAPLETAPPAEEPLVESPLDTVPIDGTIDFGVGEDLNEWINNMANTQYQISLNTIQTAYDQALAEIERQKENLATQYSEGRRAIDVQAAKAAKSLSDYLAARGLSSSGAAAQGAIQQSIAEQEAITGNLSAEQEAYKDLSLAELDLESTYQTELANAKLEALNTAQAMAYEEYQYQRNIAREDEEMDFQRELETITQYSDDYQAEINRRMEIDPNDPLIPYLNAYRNAKITANQERLNDAAAAQAKAIADGKADLWNDQFKLFEEVGYINTELMSEVLGMPMGTKTQDYEEQINSMDEDVEEVDLSKFEDNINSILETAEFESSYGTTGDLGFTPAIREEKVREYVELLWRTVAISSKDANDLLMRFGYYGNYSDKRNNNPNLSPLPDLLGTNTFSPIETKTNLLPGLGG